MKVFESAVLHDSTEDGHFRRMVCEAPMIRAGMLGFGAHETFEFHAHGESAEIFYFVSGSARFFTSPEDTGFDVRAGDLVVLEPGEMHRFQASEENLVVLAIVAPNREDTIRGV